MVLSCRLVHSLGGTMFRSITVLSAAIAAVLMGAAPAHADADSYIRYLNDHGIFVPGINDAVRISRGSQVCTSLHNGMTPQQIIDANPIVYFDLRGVIDAAQHELCPDTLH
jgi:Protein of unknown function (DUF732)